MAEILIADDDEILSDLITYRLEHVGHKVVRAADGEIALQLAISGQPDLIVLDAMMPIVSGMEVLSALKQDANTRDIPVIMLTARKGEADIVAALEAGASDYLTKPFIPQELLTRISMQLKRTARDTPPRS